MNPNTQSSPRNKTIILTQLPMENLIRACAATAQETAFNQKL